MTELLLVIIIVQLGFVLNRLHKKGDSAKESVFDRFEREQKGNAVFVAPSFASCTVARVRSLSGRQGAFLLTSLRQRRAAASSSIPTTNGCLSSVPPRSARRAPRSACSA